MTHAPQTTVTERRDADHSVTRKIQHNKCDNFTNIDRIIQLNIFTLQNYVRAHSFTGLRFVLFFRNYNCFGFMLDFVASITKLV